MCIFKKNMVDRLNTFASEHLYFDEKQMCHCLENASKLTNEFLMHFLDKIVHLFFSQNEGTQN